MIDSIYVFIKSPLDSTKESPKKNGNEKWKKRDNNLESTVRQYIRNFIGPDSSALSVCVCVGVSSVCFALVVLWGCLRVGYVGSTVALDLF
jgi:hypothetical protein